jgi:hypothetical protein
MRIRSNVNSGRAALCLVLAGSFVAFGADDAVSPSPVKGTATEEPVTEGHCGRWTSHGLKHRWLPLADGYSSLLPPTVFDGEVKTLQGRQNCDNYPITLRGNSRRASEQLTATNTLWFFNNGNADNPPIPSLGPGSWNSIEVERSMGTIEAIWEHRYTYSPGSGYLGGRGKRAKLIIDADVEVELALNRAGPSCANGGCSRGDGLAEVAFEQSGLVALAPELNAFFANRLANQQNPPTTGRGLEDLTKMVSLSHSWCRESSIESWQFGMQVRPPGFQVGGSGPNGDGQLVMPYIKDQLLQSIPLCIRPPAADPNSPSPSQFTIALEGKVQAYTKLTGTVYARTTSKVVARKLEVRFEEGCVECEPIGGEPGLEQQGGSTGAG